jgi:hypothetical protein
VFESIKSLRPHFHSLREIEGNVSLDIKLPLLWKFEEIVKPYRALKIKVQDKNETFTLVSLVANGTQEGYNVAFACAIEIIKVNKEEEEKRQLFQAKVKELEMLFQNETLAKLKDINFLENHEQQEDNTSVGVVEQGSGEGQDGSGDTEEEDD